MIITKEYLDQHRTNKGAWTRKQLTALGVEWPPKAGWKILLEGAEISEENQKIFEASNSSYAVKVPKNIKQLHKMVPLLTDDQLVHLIAISKEEFFGRLKNTNR